MCAELRLGVGNPSKETERKQELFLKAYRKFGTKTKSARAAKIEPSRVSSWRRTDMLFLERMKEAEEAYNDGLEEILNDLIAEQHKNLDYKSNPTLLIFKMNGAMPWKYKGVTPASTEAKDVLSEFRKAMREFRGHPSAPPPMVDEEEKSALEQARLIVQGRFGALNDSEDSA